MISQELSCCTLSQRACLAQHTQPPQCCAHDGGQNVWDLGVQAQHRVMRGTWFVEKGQDWVPLRETIADELETAFRSEVSAALLVCTCVRFAQNRHHE